MNDHPRPKSWFSKFANAFRGIAVGVRSQNSFAVHLPVALAVIVFAVVRQVDTVRFSVLLLCIVAVISAELFNSSVERLASSINRKNNQDIRDALDMAAGAVLCVSIGSAAVGGAILVQPTWQALFGQ